MDLAEPPDLFVGDLSDPWLAAIAEAMPRKKVCLDVPTDWPDTWPEAAAQARVIVLHRQTLSSKHADGLKRLRARAGGPPKIVLCIGPYIRAADLDRWGSLVDVVLTEATAPEVIARHVEPVARTLIKESTKPRVAVVSRIFETSRVLMEGCGWVGYPSQACREWDEAKDAEIALWDVPVLEESWDEELARETKKRRVAALLGFADRTSVTRAKNAGAVGCLDLPFDLADLAFLLDRLAREPRLDSAHAVPPLPMGRRLAGSRTPARKLK